MSQQSEALNLADTLDQVAAIFSCPAALLLASAELRRLHAENEALKEKLGLVDYVLQDDIHNQLTPRVVDIAYSAFMIAKSGKNKDDCGPCDWFNDTKPMVMGQLEKIKKHLA